MTPTPRTWPRRGWSPLAMTRPLTQCDVERGGPSYPAERDSRPSWSRGPGEGRQAAVGVPAELACAAPRPRLARRGELVRRSTRRHAGSWLGGAVIAIGRFRAGPPPRQPSRRRADRSGRRSGDRRTALAGGSGFISISTENCGAAVRVRSVLPALSERPSTPAIWRVIATPIAMPDARAEAGGSIRTAASDVAPGTLSTLRRQ